MTRAESMDVINDSTTMQSRIDSVLAAPIMEWDNSPEIRWQPGDPLYTYGKGNVVRRMIALLGVTFIDTHEWDYENNRPIYEVAYSHDDTFDGYDFRVDCKDCLVGIGNDETHCWMCGKMLMMMSKNEKARLDSLRQKDAARRRQVEWGRFLDRASDVEELEYQGNRISYHHVRWMADFLRETPNRDHVQIARMEPILDMFRDYDSGPGPESIQRTTLMFDRRQVAEMEEMMFTEIRERQIERLWAQANEPLRIRGIRPSMVVMDEAHDLPQHVMNDIVHTYARADVDATAQMYNFTTQDEHDALWGSLQALRDLIDFPPSYTVVEPLPARGVPIFWGVPMSEWATLHIINFEEEDASPEADLDIPRLSARAIRPDLYRPGYEQYFNQGEPNAFTRALHHSAQARSDRRH